LATNGKPQVLAKPLRLRLDSLEVDSITITLAQKLQDVFRRRFRMLVVILWGPTRPYSNCNTTLGAVPSPLMAGITNYMSIWFDGQNRLLSDAVGCPNEVGLKHPISKLLPSNTSKLSRR